MTFHMLNPEKILCVNLTDVHLICQISKVDVFWGHSVVLTNTSNTVM